MDTRGIRHILSLLFLLSACEQGELPVTPSTDTGARSQLVVGQEVAQATGEVVTRSVVTGTSLAENGRTYGLIVCKHEDTPTTYEIYDKDNANIYGNIQAWYGNYNNQGTDWWYSFAPTADSRFKPLYLVTDDVSEHLDIYAYAPWKAGITLQDGYAYNLTNVAEANLPDLMYATYEGVSHTNLAIAQNTTIPLSLHFHHALARIAFHFKLANPQNTGLDGQHAVRLYQISLLHTEAAATPLYTSGTMDLLTGNVTTTQMSSQKEQMVTYATQQNVTDGLSSYDIYRGDTWTTFNMLVHPTTYQTDGDFSFRFHFNGTGLAQDWIQTYAIPRSNLLHSDGTTYGFQPGYCYHFYYIIDNYIHLQNVVIDTNWTLTDEQEINI